MRIQVAAWGVSVSIETDPGVDDSATARKSMMVTAKQLVSELHAEERAHRSATTDAASGEGEG